MANSKITTIDIYLHNHPKTIVFTFKNTLYYGHYYLDIFIFKMNINYHEFGKRTQENLPKLLKKSTVSISWNKPSKGQAEENLIKRKVNKVLSFVGNLIENIFLRTQVLPWKHTAVHTEFMTGEFIH